MYLNTQPWFGTEGPIRVSADAAQILYERDCAEHAGFLRYCQETGYEPPHPLDVPPGTFGLVMNWLDDAVNYHGATMPSQAVIDVARQLPETSTLRDVLRALGLTDAQIKRVDESEY